VVTIFTALRNIKDSPFLEKGIIFVVSCCIIHGCTFDAYEKL